MQDDVARQIIDPKLDLQLLLTGTQFDGDPGHQGANTHEDKLEHPVGRTAHFNADGGVLGRSWLEDVDDDDAGEQQCADTLLLELHLAALPFSDGLYLENLLVTLRIIANDECLIVNSNLLASQAAGLLLNLRLDRIRHVRV
mgnify:FL=1